MQSKDPGVHRFNNNLIRVAMTGIELVNQMLALAIELRLDEASRACMHIDTGTCTFVSR